MMLAQSEHIDRSGQGRGAGRQPSAVSREMPWLNFVGRAARVTRACVYIRECCRWQWPLLEQQLVLKPDGIDKELVMATIGGVLG